MALLELKKSDPDHTHECTISDNHAKVMMDPSDRMTFVVVEQLTTDDEQAKIFLKDLVETIYQSYGGKIALRFMPPLAQRITADWQKAIGLITGGHSARFCNKDSVLANAELALKKAGVQSQHAKIASGEYQLLTNAALLENPDAVLAFQIAHSSFIANKKTNHDKVRNGQYTKLAVERKLRNPNVIHYALRHQDQLVATVKLVIHGDLIYVSDYIVHADYRSKGLAQAFLITALKATHQKYPHLSGGWIIPGGHGTLGLGPHLFNEVFPSDNLNNADDNTSQQRIGLYLNFTSPGPELLTAAHATSEQLTESKQAAAIAEALELAEQSLQPQLGAPPPANVMAQVEHAAALPALVAGPGLMAAPPAAPPAGGDNDGNPPGAPCSFIP